MGTLHDIPSGERLRIGFFGMRNAGKSSLVNSVTGQDLSVVSEVPGTTTDAVRKSMEILPLGPVVIIDTPGLDDEGALGAERIRRAEKELAVIDLAVLVIGADRGVSREDAQLLRLLGDRNTAHIVACSKADLFGSGKSSVSREAFRKQVSDIAPSVPLVFTSAENNSGIHELKETLASFGRSLTAPKPLVRDLVPEGSSVVLVIPIDASAPKGRIILPQQMVLRELLDHHCRVTCCQVRELSDALRGETPPGLVITDSQVFEAVSGIVPESIPLTSFSILMARYKGTLDAFIKGADLLSGLRDGDPVLVAEGCTHHRQCEDIGTVKLPAWIRSYSGAEPVFSFCSGKGYPEDLASYRLILHCGGCMLSETEMKHRLSLAEEAGVPIVNYGIAIAMMKGILPRALAVFR